MRPPFAHLLALLLLALLAALATPVQAWTPKSQRVLGQMAVELSPRDFRRQIQKHEARFDDGMMAPFRDADPSFHESNDDGTGRLHEALEAAIARTIAAIKSHMPFSEIAFEAGIMVHYANDLNNPLNCSAADPEEGKFFLDYLRYMESTEDRLEVLFYGLSERLEAGDVKGFIAGALERCRELYPMVGSEYRRVGKLPGTELFDDRSTAFGLSGVVHSRAATDAALLLRYVWIEAGGADWRRPPLEKEGRMFRVATEKP